MGVLFAVYLNSLILMHVFYASENRFCCSACYLHRKHTAWRWINKLDRPVHVQCNGACPVAHIFNILSFLPYTLQVFVESDYMYLQICYCLLYISVSNTDWQGDNWVTNWTGLGRNKWRFDWSYTRYLYGGTEKVM